MSLNSELISYLGFDLKLNNVIFRPISKSKVGNPVGLFWIQRNINWGITIPEKIFIVKGSLILLKWPKLQRVIIQHLEHLKNQKTNAFSSFKLPKEIIAFAQKPVKLLMNGWAKFKCVFNRLTQRCFDSMVFNPNY